MIANKCTSNLTSLKLLRVDLHYIHKKHLNLDLMWNSRLRVWVAYQFKLFEKEAIFSKGGA